MRAPKNQQASVPCPRPQDGSSANGWLSDFQCPSHQHRAGCWAPGSMQRALRQTKKGTMGLSQPKPVVLSKQIHRER